MWLQVAASAARAAQSGERQPPHGVCGAKRTLRCYGVQLIACGRVAHRAPVYVCGTSCALVHARTRCTPAPWSMRACGGCACGACVCARGACACACGGQTADDGGIYCLRAAWRPSRAGNGHADRHLERQCCAPALPGAWRRTALCFASAALAAGPCGAAWQPWYASRAVVVTSVASADQAFAAREFNAEGVAFWVHATAYRWAHPHHPARHRRCSGVGCPIHASKPRCRVVWPSLKVKSVMYAHAKALFLRFVAVGAEHEVAVAASLRGTIVSALPAVSGGTCSPAHRSPR